MKEHEGHRSWNAWNVALYVSNDEPLYRIAQECARQSATHKEFHKKFFQRALIIGDKTPDGAVYNHLSLKLALDGLELPLGRA